MKPETRHRLKHGLQQIMLVLTLLALSGVAQASYGQMRLDGVVLLLAFFLLVAYGLIVDLVLWLKLFRYRPMLIGGLVVATAITALLVALLWSPNEREGYFKGTPGGQPLVVMVLTFAVFIPFIFLAPIAQFRAMRDERRWPAWVPALMVMQAALIPLFIGLGRAEEHFWQRDYVAAQAIGRAVTAGGLNAIRASADEQHERIWGTGWPLPWPSKARDAYSARSTAWMAGLARGVDASALIAAQEPLSNADRQMLQALIDKHFINYAIPSIQTKLIWDALAPGNFTKLLAPRGLSEPGVVSEEVIARLLARLEAPGAARLCPDGRMVDADRAILTQLVVAKARHFEEARKREARAEIEEKAREREMQEAPFPFRFMWNAAGNMKDKYGGQDVKVPDWSSFPQRVERLCGGVS